MPKLKLRESDHQEQLVKYLLRLKSVGKVLEFFAPINENTMGFKDRNLVVSLEKKARKMGKRKGVSDIVVVLKKRILFIELKREDGKPSKAQLEFLNGVNNSFVCTGEVCYGFQEAKELVEEMLQYD
jgi:hypothetical protein